MHRNWNRQGVQPAQLQESARQSLLANSSAALKYELQLSLQLIS